MSEKVSCKNSIKRIMRNIKFFFKECKNKQRYGLRRLKSYNDPNMGVLTR